MRRPHWRKMTWVLIIWSGLIVLWVISGANAASHSCAKNHIAGETCNAATGLGIAVILFIGFIGFVFFSLIWLMSKPKRRDCPVCGEKVKRGLTVCPSCNHDFAAAAAAGQQPLPS